MFDDWLVVDCYVGNINEYVLVDLRNKWNVSEAIF